MEFGNFCQGELCNLLYYLIPFLFTYALLFLSIEVSGIFGAGRKNLKSLIALAISFFAMLYKGYVEFVYGLTPYIAYILIIIFVILLIKTLVVDKLVSGKGKVSEKEKILLLVFLFLGITTFSYLFPNSLSLPFLSSQDIIFLAALILVVLILYLGYGHTIEREQSQRREHD